MISLRPRPADIRYRPGVGTVTSTVTPTGRYVTVHLVDAARPDEQLPVPDAVLPLLDDCWSPAAVRALLAGTS
jgi:hypothetical protein